MSDRNSQANASERSSNPHVGEGEAVAARRFRHVKRGSTYTEIGRGKLQVDMHSTLPVGALDMSDMVIYRADEDGSLWTRPVEDFEDGRFVEIESHPPRPEIAGWQDISTAPKDGIAKPLLLCVPRSDETQTVGEAYWHQGEDGEDDYNTGWWWAGTSPGDYYDDKLVNTNAEPTHWQPLPAPPVSEGE